jgi:hypothetical protein
MALTSSKMKWQCRSYEPPEFGGPKDCAAMKKAMTNSYPGDVGLTPTVKAIQSRKGSNSMLSERDQRISKI